MPDYLSLSVDGCCAKRNLNRAIHKVVIIWIIVIFPLVEMAAERSKNYNVHEKEGERRCHEFMLQSVEAMKAPRGMKGENKQKGRDSKKYRERDAEVVSKIDVTL